MKCDYCDSVFDDDIVLETCPNCGGVFSEEETLADIPDEEKRRRLQASGVKYCPHCLSTNVSKRKMFADKGCFVLFLFALIAAIVFFVIAPWAIWIPVAIWLLEWLVSTDLVCKDCKLQWSKLQKKDYEKYFNALHIALQGKTEIRCAGVNAGALILGISNFSIEKDKTKKLALYRNITAVEHREPAGDVFGYLSVRDEFNKNKPFPQSYEEAVKDPMTILYEPSQVAKYRKVYTAFQQIAQINSCGG